MKTKSQKFKEKIQGRKFEMGNSKSTNTIIYEFKPENTLVIDGITNIQYNIEERNGILYFDTKQTLDPLEIYIEFNNENENPFIFNLIKFDKSIFAKLEEI